MRGRELETWEKLCLSRRRREHKINLYGCSSVSGILSTVQEITGSGKFNSNLTEGARARPTLKTM
jgi:hypothetical protein